MKLIDLKNFKAAKQITGLILKNLSDSYWLPQNQAKIPRKACFSWFFFRFIKTSFNLEFLGKKFVHPKLLSK